MLGLHHHSPMYFTRNALLSWWCGARLSLGNFSHRSGSVGLLTLIPGNLYFQTGLSASKKVMKKKRFCFSPFSVIFLLNGLELKVTGKQDEILGK